MLLPAPTIGFDQPSLHSWDSSANIAPPVGALRRKLPSVVGLGLNVAVRAFCQCFFTLDQGNRWGVSVFLFISSLWDETTA